METPESKRPEQTYEACPHCGHRLSPWQQILLSVDRALMCKNCWYRIILPVYEDPAENESPSEQDDKGGK
jgi:DNA-directed RNA polymerase subunit RPC12/RpoP